MLSLPQGRFWPRAAPSLLLPLCGGPSLRWPSAVSRALRRSFLASPPAVLAPALCRPLLPGPRSGCGPRAAGVAWGWPPRFRGRSRARWPVGDSFGVALPRPSGVPACPRPRTFRTLVLLAPPGIWRPCGPLALVAAALFSGPGGLWSPHAVLVLRVPGPVPLSVFLRCPWAPALCLLFWGRCLPPFQAFVRFRGFRCCVGRFAFSGRFFSRRSSRSPRVLSVLSLRAPSRRSRGSWPHSILSAAGCLYLPLGRRLSIACAGQKASVEGDGARVRQKIDVRRVRSC